MRSSAVLFLAVSALLVGGATRLAYLEQTQGPELRRQAERQQRATTTIPAQRGSIIDTRGRVLAESTRTRSVFVDPSRVEDVEFAVHSVAPVLSLSPRELRDILQKRGEDQFVWLRRNVSDAEIEAFNNIRKARRLSAFGVMPEPKRVYLHGRLASQVIGFVSGDDQGLAGVEQMYDDLLRGTPGRRTSTVDVRRRRVRSRDDQFTPPHDGHAVVLTLDSYVQTITEKHLRAAVERHQADWGAAIVMDPQSGEIMAMSSIPDFDPNNPIPPGTPPERISSALEQVQNRAIAYAYEPGSIFKPFIASLALEEKLVRLDETFAINGPVHSFGSRVIHDTHAYGSLLMAEVISKSSNIGMAMLGERVRNERLYRYVRLFGFGDLTGVGLPGEHHGLVNDYASWGPFSTQSIPIGQEIAVTPVQICAAFSVFCNGGILYRPRIVRGVLSASGEMVEDHSRPVPIRRVLSPEVTERFRLEALAEAVIAGTGKSAKLPDYQVFGKTGTAQMAGKRGSGYAANRYIGSFVGGAPSDRPRVVVLVSISWPKAGGYYGGVVSAPVVKDILADTLAYMQVPAELKPDEQPRTRLRGRGSEAAADD